MTSLQVQTLQLRFFQLHDDVGSLVGDVVDQPYRFVEEKGD